MWSWCRLHGTIYSTFISSSCIHCEPIPRLIEFTLMVYSSTLTVHHRIFSTKDNSNPRYTLQSHLCNPISLKTAPEETGNPTKLYTWESHKNLPCILLPVEVHRTKWILYIIFSAAYMSRLLSLDLRWPMALERNRNHQRNGDESQKNGRFSVGDSEWKSIRWNLS